MKVDWVPFGEICQLDRERIEIDPAGSYAKVGILSWGKGLIRYPSTPGTEMGSMKYFSFPTSSLMFSNIQAWEGAVALTDKSDEERVCSSRFYPYVPIDDERVVLTYLIEYFKSAEGQRVMRQSSTGTQVRNKVLNRALLERHPVPIPSLANQARIAEHLEELSRVTPNNKSEKIGDNALSCSMSKWLDQLPSARLSELMEFASRPQRVDAEAKVNFVPMAAVDSESGEINGATTKSRSEVGTGYRQFKPGDVIFARITPCMQNGKCAIYSDSEARIGYGSSEFFVLRPDSLATAEWVWLLLRTGWFTSRAMKAFTGTAGQQRVPADFMRSISIPWPVATELTEATARLREDEHLNRRVGRLRTQRDELASAVLPAARNEIFNAMR